MEVRLNKIGGVIIILLWAYFTWLMVLITAQYVPIDFKAAFLNVKDDVIDLKHYQWAFFLHVYTSIFVLVLGVFQFLPKLRKSIPVVHRLVGKVYIVLILFVAGPSGLIMGYYANGGWVAQSSFLLLSILWVYFTYLGFNAAKNKNWSKHQKWMIFSYALTLSAISLRLFKWLIANTLELPPMDMYRIVAWLSWTVNMLVAYLIINHKKQ